MLKSSSNTFCGKQHALKIPLCDVLQQQLPEWRGLLTTFATKFALFNIQIHHGPFKKIRIMNRCMIYGQFCYQWLFWSVLSSKKYVLAARILFTATKLHFFFKMLLLKSTFKHALYLNLEVQGEEVVIKQKIYIFIIRVNNNNKNENTKSYLYETSLQKLLLTNF